MPKLSIVMIVKNESAWLAQCLESVRVIADEIVIADTGSTDDTRDIANRFDARILDVPWTNDFAAARNAVNDAATGDWLLHMDADESLDDSGAQQIRAIVDADGNGADAVELMLANYCDDIRAWRWTPVAANDPSARGRAGYIAVPLLRLFRNRRGYVYREPVHENITESVVESGGVIGRAHHIVIHHHGYGKGGSSKADLYRKIAEKKVALRPNDPKAWHDLGEQLVSMNRPDDAESMIRKALELDPRHLAAATTLANLLLNRGDIDVANRVLEPFADSQPPAPHVLVALAAIATRKGNMTDAQTFVERALAAAPHHILALLTAARIADVAGSAHAASTHLETARQHGHGIKEVTNRVEAHALRAQAYALAANENPKAALGVLVEALKRDPEDPLIHLSIAHVLEVLDDATRADQSRQRAYALAPSLKSL